MTHPGERPLPDEFIFLAARQQVHRDNVAKYTNKAKTQHIRAVECQEKIDELLRPLVLNALKNAIDPKRFEHDNHADLTKNTDAITSIYSREGAKGTLTIVLPGSWSAQDLCAIGKSLQSILTTHDFPDMSVIVTDGTETPD